MKARIKATGEIINIADYAAIELDKCDSYGNPICLKPEEVELIQEVSGDRHWQDVRERAAIAIMAGIIANSNPILVVEPDANKLAKGVIKFADALVKQLRGE